MNGYQPKITCELCKSFNICSFSKKKLKPCDKFSRVLPPPPISANTSIIPAENKKDIIALTEQLNNLIDRYNTLYSIYAKPYFAADPENNPALRLAKVLECIEKAIDALCLRITTYQGILTIKE